VEGRRAATKDGKFVVADTPGAVREILLTELSEDPLHLGAHLRGHRSPQAWRRRIGRSRHRTPTDRADGFVAHGHLSGSQEVLAVEVPQTRATPG
jgi:hypothetical protein